MEGVPSLFHPITPGVMICVAAALVITSAITPEPGVGSVVSALLASLLVSQNYQRRLRMLESDP